MDIDEVMMCSSEAWLVVGSRLIQKPIPNVDQR